MKIVVEKSLRNFEFWSGAVSTADQFTCDELDAIEAALEDMYPDGIDELHPGGMSETDINDLFWFEPEICANLAGLEWDDEKGKIIR